MKVRKIVFLSALLGVASSLHAETPLWLRQSQISPDGKQIAFCYKGDIFTVPTQGGEARQLTSNAAYDTAPVWSPDGTKIAFASDREGAFDVYVMQAKGGQPTRLTNSPVGETPLVWKDAETILFQSAVRPSAQDMEFPGGRWNQVYAVSTKGGRPVMVSSMPMENISISADGKTWLYTDYKGYEDPWRKHHTSVITRDIWKYTPSSNTYEKQTSFEGEDRNAVWGDNGTFYYLSEKSGSMNIYKQNGTSATQITRFDTHPVRFLSRSNNGVLCFSYNGELYTMTDGGSAQKVNIEVISDSQSKQVIRQVQRSGATDLAVSPNGKEIAFVLHGDVYVTSTEYATTRQITDTPDQERSVDFAPDGKAVVYASERKGLWQVYQTKIADAESKQLLYAKELKEENLTKTDQTSFYPQYSPDGKKVAYLENRTTIRVVDIATGAINTAMDGKWEYSYSDGDQYFTWSPDSRWLLCHYIGIGGWHNRDVALVKADGTELHNLTESGYNDSNPHWVLGGKAMLWSSDKAGYRSHGSWGTQDDYYLMFFDVDAYDRFLMSKEEADLQDADKKEEKKDAPEKPADKKGGKPAPQPKKEDVKPLTFDLENARDRVVRVTVSSANMGDAFLDKKGEVLYYGARFEGGMDLWKHDLKKDRTEKVEKGIGYSFAVDKDEKNLYFLTRGGMRKLDLAKGSSSNIDFEALFNYRPAQERAYMFDHIWRQVNEKFYDPTIRNIDWKGYHDNYEKFLPYIENNYDFQDMLSELLGELNGSHTGARFSPARNTLPVGVLGLFYDNEYKGNGLKIKEIIAKSPLTKKKNDVVEGCIIEKIDGTPIEGTNEYYLLAGKIGKKVTLSILNPSSNKRFDVDVKPISAAQERDLLYQRWVERNRKIVEEKSGGKVGYIHIKGMDSPSFRTLYHEALGRYRNTPAIIVDTRHNGGGWLHDDVCTLLNGKEYSRYTPRGQFIGRDPFNKYTGKSCMLVCEDNYSNAHGTPWLYKELGIGKLIGTPVPGTMTAVWWETLIDPTMVFGIPMVGDMDNRGEYLENQQLYPDITVYNNPADVQNGKDAQLEAAIAEMLKEVGK
ncbi:MAG: S41 family peptidase [Bacteroidaceae bacterium]|nr:S41 family peptidase [Bacteroidaceae bacterium]MDO4955500.1 S41 family peptidase [Bacteroidales bacterium]